MRGARGEYKLPYSDADSKADAAPRGCLVAAAGGEGHGLRCDVMHC